MKGFPFFYILPGLNPFEHLATEDFLLRSTKKFGMALWAARPSVVLGRFQNPWQEVYWQKLKQLNIWPIRRQSGGGTIYQDAGNLNFSFFGNLKDLNKKANLNLIQDAFLSMGIFLQQNERYDLFYENEKKQKLKISGNAFKQTKDRFLHHGTLLIDADINRLKKVLNPPNWNIQSKAVDSKRSAVINLKVIPHQTKELNIYRVIKAIKQSFDRYWMEKGVRGVKVEFANPKSFINSQTLNKLRDDAWFWQETPNFCWNFGDNKFYFVDGGLKDITGPASTHLQFLKGLKVWQNNSAIKSKIASLPTKIFNHKQTETLKNFLGLA